jgi:hypothetical protein
LHCASAKQHPTPPAKPGEPPLYVIPPILVPPLPKPGTPPEALPSPPEPAAATPPSGSNDVPSRTTPPHATSSSSNGERRTDTPSANIAGHDARRKEQGRCRALLSAKNRRFSAGRAEPRLPRCASVPPTKQFVTLGLGQLGNASRAFERALALGVPSGLEEDVFARLVEAQVRAGNRAAARGVADEYSRRFPAGRRRADVAGWLAR